MERRRRKWGQCFLRDPSLARKIARALAPTAPTLVEVGGGAGILTQALREEYPHKDLWVVEVDPQWARRLRERFPHLPIVNADFLRWRFEAAVPGPVSIVGNFPYSISGALAVHVVQRVEKVPSWGGMWQREVARRLVAQPATPDYGLPSVFVGAFYRREYLFDVGPTAFRPRPKVWSAVTRFVRRSDTEGLDPTILLKLLKTAFAHRRKKLRNNLPPEWLEALADFGLADLRAEQVDVDTWAAAARRFATLQLPNLP